MEDEWFIAKGKCLLAGAYAILFDGAVGLVISTPHHFKARVFNFEHSQEQPKEIEVSVFTPQFPTGMDKYVCKWATETLEVVSSSGNKFIDCAVCDSLRLLYKNSGRVLIKRIGVEILQTSGFIRKEFEHPDKTPSPSFTHSVAEVEKTGLGSSACITVSLVGAILAKGLQNSTLTKLQKTSLIHLVSQCANNQAQGKIGSGFDISCAVFGSQIFTRIPSLEIERLQKILEKKDPLAGGLHGLAEADWIPKITTLEVTPFRPVLIEYEGGSDTRLAVKAVLDYLSANPTEKNQFIAKSNELVSTLSEALVNAHQEKALKQLSKEIRKLMKGLGIAVGVEIEPDIASVALDFLIDQEDINFAICPGAGGYDALALLVSPDFKDEMFQKHFKTIAERALELSQHALSLEGIDLKDKIKAGETLKLIHFRIL